MLLFISAGWLIASVTLYTYLIRTATEPVYVDCMDCKSSECTSCPILTEQKESAMKVA